MSFWYGRPNAIHHVIAPTALDIQGHGRVQCWELLNMEGGLAIWHHNLVQDTLKVALLRLDKNSKLIAGRGNKFQPILAVSTPSVAVLFFLPSFPSTPAIFLGLPVA